MWLKSLSVLNGCIKMCIITVVKCNSECDNIYVMICLQYIIICENCYIAKSVAYCMSLCMVLHAMSGCPNFQCMYQCVYVHLQ